MKYTLKLSFVFALACLVSASLTAPSWGGEERLLKGRYLRSDVGDFPYAVFDVNGEEVWLMCGETTTDILDRLGLQTDVIAVYEVSEQFLPEAGEKVEVRQVLSVFVPDSYSPDFGVFIREGPAPR
jgi:hypothetical protein